VYGFAFFVRIDTEFGQESSEHIRESLLSRRDEIAAASASTLFCPALLQLRVYG